MRVFVYEYLCATTNDDTPAAMSLRTEGWAMLSAVLEDLARCPGVEALTLVQGRLAQTLSALPVRVLTPPAEDRGEEMLFRSLAGAADFSLVIAPEFDDVLAERCSWAEEGGGRLLGPSSAAVRLTADKLRLARHWLERGIATPMVIEWPPSYSYPHPVVLKPRSGAGSQATFLVRPEDDLPRTLLEAGAEGWDGEMIVQPFVPGVAASVSFLAGPEGWHAAPGVQQLLSDDGRFRYLGGRTPLPAHLDVRARGLAGRAVGVVEGLHGWFGVDLVLGHADDGSEDVVIEINPRLTTSYVGLRRLARFNLAATLLTVASGTPLPCWDWDATPLTFRADGRIVGA